MAIFNVGQVEAMQVDKDRLQEAAEWLNGAQGTGGWFWYEGQPVIFTSPQGEIQAEIDDWLVKVGGSYVVVKDNDFRQSFIAEE